MPTRRHRASSTVLAVTVGLLATACTGAGPWPLDGGDAAAEPAGTAAVAGAPPEPAIVLPDADDAAQALAVSAALWREAPVAVLAPADDPTAVRRAAETARGVPAPLLLLTSTNQADVAAELDRVGTEHVLAPDVPAEALDAVTAQVDVEVRDGGDAPRVELRGPADRTVLLVAGEAGTAPPGATPTPAAVATASAAGAHVVPVAGPDPRADPASVRALAERDIGAVLALGSGFGDAAALRWRTEVAATGVELPGGGQTLFPGRRLVALYGHPGTGSLGVLGEQGPREALARAQQLAGDYQPFSAEPVVPAFEVIATVADSSPGGDGNYSRESSIDTLRPYVEAAGAAGGYVVLDLQPGRTDFTTQARRYEELLRLPYVGLALDPEWRLAPDEEHLRQIGSVSAAEVNAVADWLASIVREERLPQKLLLLHQFRRSMITDRETVDATRDELAVLMQMDGDGVRAEKLATWESLKAGAPEGLWFGWKNFYDEDSPTFTPEETLAVQPTPWWVSYQ